MALKKYDLGVLQALKTRSACKREHDSVVLSDSRKNLILGWFWKLVLVFLGYYFGGRKWYKN